MNEDVAAIAGRRQDRHAVARLSGPLSLRTRLSLLVGFIVALVVGAAAYLELHTFTSTMEAELTGAARVTARAVADDMELRSRADDNVVESGLLHEFLEVNPAVRAITVIELDGATPKTVLSTSSDERRPAIELARRAITEESEVDEVSGPMRFVAVPFVGPRGPMSVVVTVSTAAVERVARDGGLLALYVMLPAIVIDDRPPRLARAPPGAPPAWRDPGHHAPSSRRRPARPRRGRAPGRDSVPSSPASTACSPSSRA